ncbi:MAG: DUF3899 domain-containing protein [Clostridia bacterium]|nr:DUF3899 domain-containing protein [Clostridia bacterium]
MKVFNKNTLIVCIVQAVIALAIATAVAYAQGFAPSQEAMLWCRHFSDGMFVAAMMLGGLGALIWVSSTGFFDIFSYAFSSLLVLFSPMKHAKEHKHYYEHKCEREAKREGKAGPGSMLIVGLCCLALSLILLVLYYQLGGV